MSFKTQIFILNYLTDHLTLDLLKTFPDAVVVDNSEPVEQFKGHNHILYMGKNLGFTKAWNKAMMYGFDKLGCDAVMLCNNDIKIKREDVGQAIDYVSRMPDCGVASLSCNSPHHNVMTTNKWGSQWEGKPWLEFVAPIITRKAYEKVGLFDETFASGWGVELDYCYRCREEGFKNYLFGDLKFHHMGQQTTDQIKGYYDKANHEMNKLSEKYGEKWQEILSWPQW